MIARLASKLMSIIPENHLKNHFRCWFYNKKQNYFSIHFRQSLFHVRFEKFELFFEKNPFHLLIEQQQYNRYYSLKEGDTVVDAGAFWGTYAMYAAKKVGKTGKVFVFEPDASNRNQLDKNIELNKIDNIKVIPKGLWSTVTSLPFTNGKELGSSFIDADSSEDFAEVTTLDRVLEEYSLPRINFIKMDIEGAELEAIDGATKTLELGSSLAIASRLESLF